MFVRSYNICLKSTFTYTSTNNLSLMFRQIRNEFTAILTNIELSDITR